MRSKYLLLFIYILGSVALYIHQAYFLDRTEFSALFFDISLLFMFYILIVNQLKVDDGPQLMLYIGLSGILLRVIMLFYLPNLSDDYFRFLWDGSMIGKGENPYLVTPETYGLGATLSQYDVVLLENMNSPRYFTVYSPLNQVLFSLAVLISPSNIVGQVFVLKFILLLFELLTIAFLPRLLRAINQPVYFAALYVLNPLVIIETVGNLHFEGVTASLLIVFFFLLVKGRNLMSSVFLGLASGIKFIPFLLFPLILKKLGLRKGIGFLLVSGMMVLLFFVPVISSELVQNMSKSLGLYFRTFEFNAGIYYVIRSLGYWIKGYNVIGTSGWMLGLISAILIILYTVGIKIQTWNSVFAVAVISMLSHYLLSTTVHPWYIINILIFSVLSGMYITGISWSYLVFLSYYAYGNQGFDENGFLLTFEYAALILILILELRFNIQSGLLRREYLRFDTK